MPDLTGLALLDTAVALIPVLASAYAVVLGGAALAAGWQLFRREPPRRFRRGAVRGGQRVRRPRPGWWAR